LESDEKIRPNAVERFLRRSPDFTPADAEPREAVKDMRAAIASPMLDVVFKTGRIVSFSYAYLTQIEFEPKGQMSMHFGDDVVVIEGRNLREVRQKVRLHKADEIVEGVEAEGGLKPEGDAHIERIEIYSEKEAKRDAKRNDPERNKGMER
jgi:hypothetical protein